MNKYHDTPIKPEDFAYDLIQWHKKNPRPMPWLETKDPYQIWISEIILQQTRVAQGWAYYQRFIQRFPTIHTLYAADETEIIKYWEGLGYYARIRNIIKTANVIVGQYNGHFPKTYDDLLKLPGIGPYTAAAIAGFAFEVPTPVLDGNVLRVVSRLLAIETPSQNQKTKQQIYHFLHQAIQKTLPSSFNQALMNYGALVCTPSNPNCPTCTFQHRCISLLKNIVASIPAKKIKMEKKERYFHYFVLTDPKQKTTLLSQRNEKDIWRLLFQFPLLEKEDDLSLDMNSIVSALKEMGIEVSSPHLHSVEKHHQLLTHQKIHFHFYDIRTEFHGTKTQTKYFKVNLTEVKSYTLPVILIKFLKSKII
ncbi:MAG: A/G-specific adenine glycosylase [Saprospiraceae bacterium]